MCGVENVKCYTLIAGGFCPFLIKQSNLEFETYFVRSYLGDLLLK